jgi:DNA-binding NarL/FixJ family response regulator
MEVRPVRFLLCDDHRLFIEPFAAALGRRGHDVVVLTRPDALLRAVDRHRPDLCVVDLKFPDANGLDLVTEVRRRHPDCRVVVLSGSAGVRDATAAASLGVVGFLQKDQPISVIFDALDRIAAGETVTPLRTRPRDGGEREQVRWLIEQLTRREREVLSRLISAEDTLDIARSMGVAPSTARTHLQNVLFKLGVHNRLQAVALVMGAGVADEL